MPRLLAPIRLLLCCVSRSTVITLGDPTRLNAIDRNLLQSDCQEIESALGSTCNCPSQGSWERFCDVLGCEAASVACCAEQNDVEVFELSHCRKN